MKGYIAGVTLLELIITISVMSILISLALPSLGHLIEQERAQATITELARLVKAARHTAVFNQTIVTLCPSNDGKNCSVNWSNGLIVFEDPNHNESIEPDEKLHYQRSIKLSGATLSWRSLHPYIQFSPEGRTRATNGSLRYCPKNISKYHLFVKLVLSVPGRSRIERADTTKEPKRILDDFGC